MTLDEFDKLVDTYEWAAGTVPTFIVVSFDDIFDLCANPPNDLTVLSPYDLAYRGGLVLPWPKDALIMMR